MGSRSTNAPGHDSGPTKGQRIPELQELVRHLDGRYGSREPVCLTISRTANDNLASELPEDAVRLLRDILDEMARGNTVAVVPIDSPLTTQQAARILGVSRPHLVSLLDAGRIPSYKVGKHRRVRLEDLLGFRKNLEEARKKTLDDLAAHDQSLGIKLG